MLNGMKYAKANIRYPLSDFLEINIPIACGTSKLDPSPLGSLLCSTRWVLADG